MQYHYIPWILEQEDPSELQSVRQRWRPRSLLLMRQVQLMLKDMESRMDSLELARDEFNTLEKASKYNRYLLRMRIWLRESKFAWRADQLRFLRSAAGFYADYGAILKLLRFDQLRGKFTEPATTVNTTGV